MIKTAEEMFQSMNGGKHSKTSVEHGETFTAAFVIQAMARYASQHPVPQQTGGYSKELKEKLLSWLMGNRILDPSSANIIIDHFERYAHPSPTAPSDAIEFAEWISVEDRLPDEGGRYWCYIKEVNDLGISHYQWNCSYNENEKRWGGLESAHVTHWQPLPPPPKK